MDLHGKNIINGLAEATSGKVFAAINPATGAGLAARHVWLQSLPADQVPACGPGLSYMLEQFPLMRLLEKVLTGSGECAEAGWRFLGLTIAGWSLLWFVLLGGLIIGLACRRR